MTVKDDKTTEATEVDAGGRADKGSESRTTTVEKIAAAREVATGKPAATESGSSTDGDTKDEAAAKAAEATKDDAKKDEAAKAKESEKAPAYTDDELSKMDLRTADPNRVPPALRTTVQRMQTAERKKHETMNKEIAEAKDLKARAIQVINERDAKKKDSAKTEDDEAEDLDRYFNKDERLSITKSPEFREAVEAAAKKMVKDLVGDVDPGSLKAVSEKEFINDVFDLAAKKEPLLHDQEFWKETLAFMKADTQAGEDGEESEGYGADLDAAVAARDRKAMLKVLRAVAAEVKSQRADRKLNDAKQTLTDAEKEKQKKRTEIEKANAKPGSIAAKAPAKGASATEKLSTIDRVRQARQQATAH